MTNYECLCTKCGSKLPPVDWMELLRMPRPWLCVSCTVKKLEEDMGLNSDSEPPVGG